MSLRNILYFFLVLLLAENALCQVSMTSGLGFFSLSGKTRSGSTSVSSPGLFNLGFSYVFHPLYDVHVSYQIQNESVISGDRAFGPNLTLRYGPWGIMPTTISSAQGLRLELKRSFLPYLKIGFAQRQFQSTRTSFSGPLLGAGVLGHLWGPLPLFTELTYSTLGGGQGATATELSLVFGVQVVF